MFKKNTAVTGFGIGHFINTTTGAAVTTGTPTCKRTIDGTGGACANAASYNTDGAVWEIDLAAGDMNGDVIILSFTLTDCLPLSYTIKTVTGVPNASGYMPSDVVTEAGRKIKVAGTDGDWGTAGTWEDGAVPAAGDSIVIKSGIDVMVAASLNLGLYGPYTILGTLGIAGGGVTSEVVPADCTIAANVGTITTNYGKVIVNSGIITDNYNTVLTNSGVVTNNYGEVMSNNLTLTINLPQGTVHHNTSAGTVVTNNGTIELNNGTVTTPSTGVILYGTGGALPVAAAGAANGVVLGSAAYKLAVDSAGKVAVPDTQKVDVNTIKTVAVAATATVTFANGTVSTLTQTQVSGGAYDLTNATYIAALKSGLGKIPATLAAADVTNNLPVEVKAWNLASITTNITGTITTVTTATNLTNLPAAPTDWIDAAAVKADAVTKVAAGVAANASIAALIGIQTGSVITETALGSAASEADIADAVAAQTAIAAGLVSIAAIEVDTNEIQDELKDGGRTDLLIDAIKTKTDYLPSVAAGGINGIVIGSAANKLAVGVDGSVTAGSIEVDEESIAELVVDAINETGVAVNAPLTVGAFPAASLVNVLESVPTTAPTGAPSGWTFRQWLTWLTHRFRKAAKTPTTLTVLDGSTTLSTQTITDDNAGSETTSEPV